MADDLGSFDKKVQQYRYHCPVLANIQLGGHVAWFTLLLGKLHEGWQGPCYTCLGKPFSMNLCKSWYSSSCSECVCSSCMHKLSLDWLLMTLISHRVCQDCHVCLVQLVLHVSAGHLQDDMIGHQGIIFRSFKPLCGEVVCHQMHLQ